MDSGTLLRCYYQDVIEPFFPSGAQGIQHMGSVGISGGVITDARITPEMTYDFFKNSKFFIENGTKLVHFTSLQNANSIVKGLKLRLYSLDSLDDPNEMGRSANTQKLLEENGVYDSSKNGWENFFIFSAVDGSVINADESIEFNMWRLYGKDGMGVALIFEYDDIPSEIYKCYLSKVFYAKDSNIIKRCIKKHNEFVKKIGLNVTGLDDVLIPMSLFYKNPIYRLEKEIRIIRRKQEAENRNPSYHYDFKNGSKVSYYEMPINTDSPGTNPKLSIAEILIGYRYSEKQVKEISEAFINDSIINLKIDAIRQTPLVRSFLAYKK